MYSASYRNGANWTDTVTSNLPIPYNSKGKVGESVKHYATGQESIYTMTP